MSIPRELINSGTTREQYHFDRYLDAAAREGRKLANRGPAISPDVPASSPITPKKTLSPALQTAYLNEMFANRSASSGNAQSGNAAPATGPNLWSAHPLWSEWLSLHGAVREAAETFPNFLALRQRGEWPAFLEYVFRTLAERITVQEQDQDRQAQAQSNRLQVDGRPISDSRARQADVQRQLAEARELGRRHGAVR